MAIKGNTANVLKSGEAYRLRGKLEDISIRDSMVNMNMDEAIAHLSGMLGFPVTEANIQSAAKDIGVQLTLARRPPKRVVRPPSACRGFVGTKDERIEILAEAVRALYLAMGLAIPPSLASVQTPQDVEDDA